MPARPRIMAPVGKSGPRHDLGQLVDGDFRVVEMGDAGVDDLAQVVRRDVGGHADGDAARAVHQQVGELGRQHHRLLEASRRSCRGTRPCSCRGRRAARARPWPAGTRCSAPPPADRRRPSRNCPGRRSAAGAWRSPAPCAPGRRRSRGCRAGGTCPSPRRRRGRDFMYFLFQSSPSSFMANRMRRCTGFRPSRTSGSARETITLMA